MGFAISNELTEILLNNGFVESKTYYKGDPIGYKNAHKHDPSVWKRYFYKGRLKVDFNNGNLHLFYNSSSSFWDGASIDYNQLKSLIFFSNLNPGDKMFFRDRIGITTISKFLMDENWLYTDKLKRNSRVKRLREEFKALSIIDP